MGMHKFQFEQWPPEYDNSQDIYGLPHKSLDEHLESQAAISEDGDNESTIGDFSQAPNNEDGLKPFDDVSVATATTTKTTSSIASNEEDDPLTKEIMHTSIEELLEALILILTHPQKTNKSCEQAIDCVTQLVTKGYISGRAGGLDDPSGSGASQREIPPAKRPQPSLLHRLMEATQKCGESSKETVQLQVIECFKAIMTSPKCSAHEASMLLAIRSVFHIYLVTKSQSCQLKAKACLMEICSSIVRRMEDSPLKQNSLFYTDSYYLMRSLVKLSSKELQGIDDKSTTQANFLTRQIFTTTSVDPLALNNKVLSLELICQIMESAGDNICYGEKFVHLVQSQLCVALLKNCMSNHTQVAFISQKTFLVLVYKFKTHLKDEIQVFMTNIFLRVLQSDNSSFAQKALVLESLRSLCSDPVLLTQIFLNYDCDFDAMNLYKDIVFHLTKLSGKSTAQPLGNMSKKDAEEHFELSLAAIEVVTTILHTFLKALNIPSPNHSEINDTAGSNIRKILGLKDVGQFNLQQFIQEELQHEDEDENFAPVVSRSSSAASLAEAAEASSHLAQGIVDAFDRKRNAEQNFEMGSVKFTLSSKSGLKFFVDNGFVTLDAKEIAIFFIDNKDKLDKTQMGEVLGREPDAAFIKGGDIDAEKGGSGFYFKILHHYIEALEFKELLFDEAIRLFLSGFRLPGEAQKIDRIMEKFAERYTRQNQEVFPNADTAFILAFSVIMLNTDLHNPSIKPERRMTLDGFQRNNRGIGENGSDLPVDFLAGIFERIKKSPFSLKEDDAAREKAAADVMDTGLFGESSFFGTSAEERKREKFKMEREEMMSATEQLIRRRRGKANASEKSLADSVAPADVVKPMFDVTWGPVIGILSQVLECSTDERSIEVCLNGFVYAIRISSHNNMSLARDTFINSLAKFTFLGSIKEMKFKNIESIRTLMTIAVADGEYLGESWGAVLQCISQLARMRMSASGLDSDESFLQIEEKAPKKKKSQTFSVFGGGNTSQQNSKITLSKEMEEMNGRAILESFSEQLIDSVFSSTVKLSARSLGHFIEQLVSVSKAELEGDNKRNITGVQSTTKQNGGSLNQGPSIFSLQKLVEVADFNMDSRPRVIWNQVWEIMADYFAEIGCHRNSMVSVFAIDSLKQLSSKFLEKPEKSERNFQRVFLNPFLLIIQNPGTPHENRELVLQCIDQMVSTKAHNLQSGWKIFFDILMVASCDSSEKIMVLAINILQRLLDEHLSKLCILPASSKKDDAVEDKEKKVDGTEMSTTEKKNRNANAEDFVGMCRASLSFVQHHDSNSRYPVGISMRALCHSAIYADLIAEGRILPPVSGTQSIDPAASGYTYDGLSEVESLEMVLWRPLLKGLADAAKFTASSRAGGVGCLVQRGSVLAIRAILLRHGALFSVEQLVCILQDTIIPSFQKAAENDLSPMISITSESPGISNLDFLAEAMPLPPPIDDPGLLKFEEVARSMDW
jgi:brefeldin A-inhibited guanine nucleotide-exchange protein